MVNRCPGGDCAKTRPKSGVAVLIVKLPARLWGNTAFLLPGGIFREI